MCSLKIRVALRFLTCMRRSSGTIQFSSAPADRCPVEASALLNEQLAACSNLVSNRLNSTSRLLIDMDQIVYAFFV